MPSISEVPHPGFGYPLCGVSHSKPGKPLSVPNTLGLRPSKLFSSPMIDSPFRINLSAPALSYKTLSDLVSALQRLTPTGKAVPLLLLPRGLVRVGAYCSLGLSDLLGLLLPLTHEVSFSLTSAPSRTSKIRPSRTLPSGTPGMSDQRKAAFPPKGCQPIWPSPPTASATSLRNHLLTDYFFAPRTLNRSPDSKCLSV
jgi:hypothetical protein